MEQYSRIVLILLIAFIVLVKGQNETTNDTSTLGVTSRTKMTSSVSTSSFLSLTSTSAALLTTDDVDRGNETVTMATAESTRTAETALSTTIGPETSPSFWKLLFPYRFYIIGGAAGVLVLCIILLCMCCACSSRCRRCWCDFCIRISCSEMCREGLVDFEQCLATCCCRHRNKPRHQMRQHYPHPFTTFDYDSSTLGVDKNGYTNGYVHSNGHVYSNGHVPMTLMGHDVPDGSISKRSDSSKSSDVNHNAVPKSKNKENQAVEITQITILDPAVSQTSTNGHVEPVTNGKSNSVKSNGHVTNSPAGFMKFRNGKGNYRLTPMRERKKIYMSSKDGDTFLFVPSCPDGDCFFRAFTIATHEILQKCERHSESALPMADDLFRFENEKVFHLRKEMCSYMREHFSRYEKKALELVHQGNAKDMDNAIPAMDIPAPIHDEQYQSFYDELNAMQHAGTYACQLEIAAVADMKKTKVYLYQKLTESPKSLRGKEPRINIAKVIELGQPEFENEINLVYMPIDHGRSGHYDALVKVESTAT